MKEQSESKVDKPVVVRIEQLSFESNGVYMDVEAHTDYVDISIGGTENEKFSVTLADWKIINEQVTKLLKQG
jgi:hypothetical protein